MTKELQESKDLIANLRLKLEVMRHENGQYKVSLGKLQATSEQALLKVQLCEEDMRNQLKKQARSLDGEKDVLVTKIQDLELNEMRQKMQLSQVQEELKFQADLSLQRQSLEI